MTTKTAQTEKISAGYFDSNRQSPIFVGDVYKEEGAMIPYHKVIKDPEKGFMVEHIGTNEKFLLKDDAKNLVKKTYLGNEFDTPDWDELVGHKKAKTSTTEKSSDIKEGISTTETTTTAPESESDDSIPADAPEDVKEFLNGETDKLPEGTETISQEEAEELEKQAKEIEKSAMEKSVETPAGEADSLESETTENVENNTNPEENSQKNEENNKTDEKTNKTPPEVIANTKEEKRLLEKRNDYKRHIEVLKRKSEELETEAVKFENLASTLTFEPFVELKMIVSNAVQDYAKKQDIKECKKHLKNYEAIDSMEALLKEYKDMAKKNRTNIELNNKEINDYEVKLTEINDKLKNFQTKLDLDSVTQNEPDSEEKSENPTNPENSEVDQPAETPAETEAKTEEKAEESTTPETKESKEETSEQPDGELLSEDDIPF